MTTSPAGDKLPNVNGLRDAKPRHSLGYRVQHRARTIVASVIAAMLVFSGTAAAATWLDVNGIIKDHSVEIIGQGSLDANTSIIDPNSGKPIEFVLIGQDSRDGEENQSVGGNFDDVVGNHQADTTMVAQISADRTKINLVSIPRDSLVDIPQCETTNGTIPAQYNVMFNSIFANAYQTGGDLASAASCTLNAVNSLTGLNIQNFIVVDFAGLVKMINAVGGVDLCIPQDVDDPYTSLQLTKGLHHLDGHQATQYARTRHGLGDGSDTSRTTRQQYLIKQLMNEALSKNLFTDTAQLYQLAKSALQSLYISQGMADTAAQNHKNHPRRRTRIVRSGPMRRRRYGRRCARTSRFMVPTNPTRTRMPIPQAIPTVLPIIRRMALTIRIIWALTTRVPRKPHRRLIRSLV